MSKLEQSQSVATVDPNAALVGFFGIADLWRLSTDDARRILGDPPAEKFDLWRVGDAVDVPMDTLRRIGYVAGIFKALQITYSDMAHADKWVRRPNRHFAGQTPLQRMLAGDVTDLAVVRSYVDAARGPWS
jgi:Protein of unknown function (DUF2384)